MRMAQKQKMHTTKHLNRYRQRIEQERKEEQLFDKKLGRKLRNTRVDNMLKGCGEYADGEGNRQEEAA